jgi:hypothetical protein
VEARKALVNQYLDKLWHRQEEQHPRLGRLEADYPSLDSEKKELATDAFQEWRMDMYMESNAIARRRLLSFLVGDDELRVLTDHLHQMVTRDCFDFIIKKWRSPDKLPEGALENLWELAQTLNQEFAAQMYAEQEGRKQAKIQAKKTQSCRQKAPVELMLQDILSEDKVNVVGMLEQAGANQNKVEGDARGQGKRVRQPTEKALQQDYADK